MNVIHSCGVIPLKKEEGKWFVLLILHQRGSHWAFPKGKAEEGETPLQTAERELKEETGLEVEKLLFPDPLSESYVFRRGSTRVTKHVAYYIGLVVGNIQLQEEEIADAKWVPLEEAQTHLSFEEAKRMRSKVQNCLREMS